MGISCTCIELKWLPLPSRISPSRDKSVHVQPALHEAWDTKALSHAANSAKSVSQGDVPTPKGVVE